MTRYKILDELLSDRYHDYTLDDLTNIVNDRLAVLDIDNFAHGFARMRDCCGWGGLMRKGIALYLVEYLMKYGIWMPDTIEL